MTTALVPARIFTCVNAKMCIIKTIMCIVDGTLIGYSSSSETNRCKQKESPTMKFQMAALLMTGMIMTRAMTASAFDVGTGISGDTDGARAGAIVPEPGGQPR